MNQNLHIIRQQFAQCVFTHKVQESACERKKKCAKKIIIINIISTFFVLVSLILDLTFPVSQRILYTWIWITVLEIMFLIVQLYFPFWDEAVKHKNSALQYLWLRDEYKNLIVDIMWGIPDNEVIIKRDELLKKYQMICSLSLQTDYKDYNEAQKKLFWKTQWWEEFTRSDKEIDTFLPEDLRFNKK